MIRLYCISAKERENAMFNIFANKARLTRFEPKGKGHAVMIFIDMAQEEIFLGSRNEY